MAIPRKYTVVSNPAPGPGRQLGTAVVIKREKLLELMAASSPAVVHHFRNPGEAVLLATEGEATQPARVLFTIETLFGRAVPDGAEFIGFSNSRELGFYNVKNKELNFLDPLVSNDAPTGFVPVDMADFATGKACTARDDFGNTWACTITVAAAAWQKVESQASAADPATIKGILSNEQVWISPVSKKKGDRCIKPEPYGWIFSTNGSVRLIDPTTSVISTRPAALNFTKVDNVK